MAGENFEKDDQPNAKGEKPLKFERPEKSDLEKIEDFLSKPLLEIEKFINEETVKRGLEKVTAASPEAAEFSKLVEYKIKSLNNALSPNERDALRTSKKYKTFEDKTVGVVMYAGGSVTYGWELQYVNGVATIVPASSFM